MADFGWRLRRGSAVRRFSDGLVVQGGPRGFLHFLACRAANRPASPAAFALLGPLGAACASEGIRRDTGIISWLHWPNLVTVDGRVVAKASLSSPGAGLQAIFDISVDCFSGGGCAFPSGLPTSSILAVLGAEIDENLLRDKILHALDWYFAEWERGMYSKLVARIQPTISWLGCEVDVTMADGRVFEGKARALDDHGSLLLEQISERRSRRTLAIPPADVALVRPVD